MSFKEVLRSQATIRNGPVLPFKENDSFALIISSETSKNAGWKVKR
jgi:hypothetical protein